MTSIAKALAIWLVILICAVANGALREGVLIPHLGKAPGLILSGVLLSALILVITYLALPWLVAPRPAQLIGLGVFWLALTLVFELSLGRFQSKSWTTILEAYTFKDGNIWPVVLLVTTAAPYIAARLRGLLA
ncbi:hypothetical protein [Ottowia thiooxydans]|uniref:hypothetical protein n=1 Tax=Ottowia thiooxydans TaxID=219182 RepID=UPI00041C92BD|nr:hypothetical protein [Ottowia thiooxydans]